MTTGQALDLRRVRATRYVTPLREGGSLPAIVEADDDGLYVLKFTAAGQGPKALIAELVAGEIGRALGLRVPEIVFVELDEAMGRSEPDPEIQDLLVRSVGLNLGLDYLPGSLAFDPAGSPAPDAELASEIVWFDAYITNVDRTARNTNLLIWHRELWLIDHGAAFYFHHNWAGDLERAASPFAAIRDHVLLPYAADIAAANERLRPVLTDELLERVVGAVPEGWIAVEEPFATTGEVRDAYLRYLEARRDASDIFTEEAVRARAEHV